MHAHAQLFVSVVAPLLTATAVARAAEPGVLSSTPVFVEDSAPFAECHASTVLESVDGEGRPFLLAAWFGGTEEGHDDVAIWLSRRLPDGSEAGEWSSPVEVANGVVGGTRTASGTADRRDRYPTWNPVLFRPSQPPEAPIYLFYKVGPSPREWWGEWIESRDGGDSWIQPRRLPDGLLGPIRSKPIELPDGVLVAGSSTEQDPDGEHVWRVHFEISTDGARSWQKVGPVDRGRTPDGEPFGAIQPTILRHRSGALQALMRTPQSVIAESWSEDGGGSWTPLRATQLPNPSAGVDAVTLRDGRHLLVYNHKVRDQGRWAGSRTRLNVAVSEDGVRWSAAAELENQPGEYSYPAVIQARDGRVHVTYTWRRKRIQHVVIDPDRLVLRPIVNGRWPGDSR